MKRELKWQREINFIYFSLNIFYNYNYNKMLSLIKQNKYSKNLLLINHCKYSSSFPNPGNDNNKYLLLCLVGVYYLVNKKHK